MPKHIGIIMDGNGRWAKARGLPRIEGHRRGKQAIETVIEAAYDLGVSYVTLYAFSSENWFRPEDEVMGLMHLLYISLKNEAKKLHKKGVRLRVIGDQTRLPQKVQNELQRVEALTQDNKNITVVLAINYGARQEITHAIKNMMLDHQDGTLALEDVTEEKVADYLYTKGIPDPDCIIRTSGESRLSNFLLWQSAYAELLFPEVLWPDFTKQSLVDAVEKFRKCERRYGKTSNQI